MVALRGVRINRTIDLVNKAPHRWLLEVTDFALHREFSRGAGSNCRENVLGLSA